MNDIRKTILTFGLLLALLQLTVAQSWSLQKDHSHVNFQIKNMGLTVDGTFEEFDADIDFNSQTVSKSKIRGVIKVSSVNTGIEKRDRHLIKEEYFDADNYEEIIFESTGIKPNGNNSYAVVGNLTIKGTTRAISFDMLISEKGNIRVFQANLPLNRRDFSVGGSSWVLADDLTTEILITLAH